MCVFVCVYERERDRESVCVCVRERERQNRSLFLAPMSKERKEDFVAQLLLNNGA